MSDLSSEEEESVSQAIEGAPEEGQTNGVDVIGDTEPTRPELHVEELAKATELPEQDLKKLSQLHVHVEVQFGKTSLPMEEILQLHSGSIVELGKLVGEPLDIVANGKVIAKAEAVVIEENYGIKITEIIGAREKLSLVRK